VHKPELWKRVQNVETIGDINKEERNVLGRNLGHSDEEGLAYAVGLQ